MNKNLKKEELCLLRLLCMAIGKTGAKKVSAEHLHCNQETLLQIAEKHAVLPLLYDVLEKMGHLDEVVFEDFQKKCQITAISNYRLLFLTRYLTTFLKEHGIIAVTLKGVSTASLYPVPELRKSGDIDFLIPYVSDCEKACLLLRQEGFALKEKQSALHHKELVNEEGISVELHGMLAEPFESQEINQYLDKLLMEYRLQMVENTEWGVSFYQPSESYHAFYLVLHMLQHFLRAGFGLKYLCDWVVFWNRPVLTRDKAVFLKLCMTSGTLGFVQVMTAVCIRYLGLKKNGVEFLYKRNGMDFGIRVTEEQIQDFLRDILNAGEFGHSAENRMVAMRGTGPVAYIREFHHQMHLNFPAAGRNILLWPGLWGVTLYRFMRNNQKIRGGSGQQILKEARKRSRLVEGLKLFKKVKGMA